MRRALILVAVLAPTVIASDALALRVAVPPPGWQPVPPGQALTTPPVREVRRAMAQLVPDVQACGMQFPPPGNGRARRLRMRVWLYPNGRWTMDVPELTPARGRPPSPSANQLRTCLHQAVARRIQQHMRPFRRRTRMKVERAYVVRMPGPPPAASALVRRARSRQRQLIACVPGATGRRGTAAAGMTDAEIVVRGELGTDGSISLIGLGVPEGVPFDAAVLCAGRELGQVEGEPVTQARAFEMTIRIRHRPVPLAGIEL